MSLIEGTMLGNYQILSKLGDGGMGTVYRAVDSMIQREVAIKALRPEIAAQPEFLERFRSEAVLLAKLNNPSIAQLYTFFNDGGQFYMVMEFVAGETFEHVIQRQGAMEWQRAFGYITQILEGIGHAHAAGILHRDLKPANVMLTPAGKIKLMDFGIAQALGGAKLTRQGRIIGTLEYLAPERIQGKPADARSDIYSVGVMLFEMLTGRLPFQSESEYDLLQQQIQKAPPDFSSLGVQVPPEVEAVVRTAMAKDPAQRYSDAEDFAGALTALLPTRRTAARTVAVPQIATAAQPAFTPRSVETPVPPPPPPIPPPPPVAKQSIFSKPAFWLAGAGVLVLAAGAIVLGTMNSRHTPTPVTIADNSQPEIYHPKQTEAPLHIDTTPADVPQEPQKTTPPPQKQPQPTKPVKSSATQPPTNPVQIPSRTPAPVPPPNPVSTRPETVPPPQNTTPPPPVQPVPAPQPVHTIVRLGDARSVLVPGQGELESYIREEIQRQMGARVRLVSSLPDADIVMRVMLDQQKGKGLSQAGRMFGMKDHATVRAVVFDARTSRIIWQQGAGDHKTLLGAFQGESLRRIAERLVRDLHEAFDR